MVCLVRDGRAYIEEFLRHYREIGVKHVVFLDNGSSDGTVETASRLGATVLRTQAPYKHYKVITKRYLIRRFGRRNWVLCVDIDELFDYPLRHKIPLNRLIAYLEAKGFTAMAAQMLDLFPADSLSKPTEEPWRTEHRYYDCGPVEHMDYTEYFSGKNVSSNPNVKALVGGVRQARFGVRALLTKHPLVYPPSGIKYINSHLVEGAVVADVTGVLLHYKYVGDFLTYFRRIVQEESFWKGSSAQVDYLRAIEADETFSLFGASARELRMIGQLVDEGFLYMSQEFVHYAGVPIQTLPEQA
ncbi:glycosyltransferase family 2 protein [Sphingosinicella sp. CPCC 101087]|uniref:glycosyltransferase family 2 protein n=1 Tax=Sphingosinicella sp. CPCC 101087 TaxID=2497754 RepID=UPI002110D799|nr:glycosyltransferase family 2 protein [Sphingosinicella sp. CPCC 101087]